ncbi:MAG: hypothetical protein RIB63_14565 [Fulvivirga sp.]
MCLTPAAITPPSLIAFKWGDNLFGRLNFYRLLPKKSPELASGFYYFWRLSVNPNPFLYISISKE